MPLLHSIVVPPTIIVLLILLARTFESSAHPKHHHKVSQPKHVGRAGVLYNSNCSTQFKLYLATWMGFRDGIITTDQLESEAPHIIDMASNSNFTEIASWLVSNGTNSIVSLLGRSELVQFLWTYKRLVQASYPENSERKQLLVVLPRECVNVTNYSNLFRVECLKMDDSGIAAAIIAHVRHTGIRKLLPIIIGSDKALKAQPEQLELYYKYKAFFACTNQDDSNLKLLRPVFGTKQLKDWLKSDGTKNIYKDGGVLGLLVLGRGRQLLSKILQVTNSVMEQQKEPAMLSTFYPWGLNSLQTDHAESNSTVPSSNAALFNSSYGLYTLEYAGSTGWDNPARRRIVAELSEFIGADPLILTAVLAYDGATRVIDASSKKSRQAFLSGSYKLDNNHVRASGVFFGITPKPAGSSLGNILQPSAFMLQDVITVSHNAKRDIYDVLDYQTATLSILAREELLSLAKLAESKLKCSEHTLDATACDPFNQLPYNYRFLALESLTEFVLIPDLYGYGLELSCTHTQNTTNQDEVTTSSLKIACTPNALDRNSPRVNCVHSNLNQKRVKRAAHQNQHIIYPDGYYTQPRDDTNLYYQPPAPAPAPSPTSGTSSGYTGGYMNMGNMGMSMMQEPSLSSTSEEPTTEAQAPTSEAPPPPPPPPAKLPDLRQILKAAKPFVGSCIGASAGCATCVIVLGRLPLSAVPAVCSGPCFVGTFGACGSLLGRVASETTIICTELFKQGYLDVETYIADAEFGKLVQERSPMTLKGYQFLATPLVHLMRSSPMVTDIVAVFAKAWAIHMKYLVGHESTDDNNWLGGFIHWIGVPVCTFAGHIVALYESVISKTGGWSRSGHSSELSLFLLTSVVGLSFLGPFKSQLSMFRKLFKN